MTDDGQGLLQEERFSQGAHVSGHRLAKVNAILEILFLNKSQPDSEVIHTTNFPSGTFRNIEESCEFSRCPSLGPFGNGV